ncbi:hypothetical protein C449_15973 [Halococcus saccharolyticus DSM 5350]|uniref:Uncharacterized protein n=1 Tax=Halococcus saccharolyticus DSM 5350 TaxID=1227455 RepID=M0ME19_9EURY|nr:hypothetical protein [Halococcus saccharolyticus]EMA42655.1 hypothetical protein C449_15973 [Halococcus saccharolyticus DSM 5350]
MSQNQDTTAWRIDPAGSDVIEMSILLESQPAPSIGTTGTWSFKLVPDGRTEPHIDRYERLVAYQDYAGLYALHEPMGGGVEYTETHDGQPPGGSLLVALRPADWDSTGRGVWGLIAGVDDSTEVPEQQCLVDVELAYLAQLGDYSDTAAVREALENGGI